MSEIVPTTIHRIVTVHPEPSALSGARRSFRSVAECPRKHCSVEAETCASCTHARGFIGADAGGAHAADGTRGVLCAVDRSEHVYAARGSVASLMRKDAVCVREDVDIDDVILLFIGHSIGGVPVVDANGKPIGIISKTDLVAAYARRSRSQCDLLDSFDADFPPGPPSVFAKDIMSPVVFKLTEAESVTRAAKLFAAQGVHRAPVVGSGGRVVGVLTSFDLVRGIVGVT